MDYPNLSFLWGADISQYSSINFNFEKYLSNKPSFIIIKAGTGIVTDPTFARNWIEAKKIGIPRAAYWYLTPYVKGKSQADKCFELLKDDEPELRIFCDWEKPYGQSDKDYQKAPYYSWNNVYDFITRLNELKVWRNKPGLYSGPDHIKTYLSPASATQSWFAQLPLWIANYKVTKPLIYKPWSTYEFWQWSESGDGITLGTDKYQAKAIDLNYFNGNETDFRKLFNLDEIPIAPAQIPFVENPDIGISEVVVKFNDGTEQRIN